MRKITRKSRVKKAVPTKLSCKTCLRKALTKSQEQQVVKRLLSGWEIASVEVRMVESKTKFQEVVTIV